LELAYLGLTDFEVKTLRQRLLSCTVESHSKLLELSNFYELIGKKERYNTILSAITSNSALQEVLAALQKRKENGMDGLIEMLWTLTLIGMFFLVPIATLALIGKIFGIKELTDAFKF